MHEVSLLAASFLASTVEAVEALTIVLAMGATRGWRSALSGAAAALLVLCLAVAIVGSSLSKIPIGTLRLCVGGFLIVFGLQWLQKAIRRAGGVKAIHDENAIFATSAKEAESVARPERGVDWYATTTTFKGVLLEGLEVVLIVVSFGSAQHHLALASLGAAGAVVVVTIAGIAIHKPLAKVPENTLKLVVGIVLTTFGILWTSEGLGLKSAGGPLALAMIFGFVIIGSGSVVMILRRRPSRRTPSDAGQLRSESAGPSRPAPRVEKHRS